MPTLEETPSTDLVYPTVSVTICKDEDLLTAEDAKSLLGWVEEPEGKQLPPEKVQFKDIHGKNVLCTQTEKFQRRYYPGVAKQLMFSILKGDWELNGDTIGIGQTGYVLDGKHRLISLVLASQEWARNPERYPFWVEEPRIETILIYGLNESPKVVNTIGTGKPRSIADSLYSTGIFGDEFKRKDVAQMARMLEHAIRLLWDRTGARDDAYLPRIDHSDALDFVSRHPTLLDMVKTVHLEDGGKERRLSRYLTPGYLSGLAYLMACSSNDGAVYRDSPERNEGVLGTLKAYDQVDTFLALLGGQADELKGYRAALGELEASINGATQEQKIGLVIKTWMAWTEKKPMTKKALTLKTEEKDGKEVIAECPTLGGIDQGPASF